MLASCGGSASDPGPSPDTSAPTRTTTPTLTTAPTPTRAPVPTWPLTGQRAKGDVDRPALVVKVDNTGEAEPQLGLSAADLVVEELVEGGRTRLAAMYQSRVPDIVGPVRSVRTTDIPIAAPAGGVLAASGGAGRVLDQLDEAGLRVLDTGDPGFSRDQVRPVPYNVMLEPAQAVASLPSGVGVPSGPYLPWGRPPAGRHVGEADVTFSGAHTTSWVWSGSSWRRVDGLAADGDEFRPRSVLILRVKVRDAGYEDPAGNPVPESVLTGQGPATLLAGAAMVRGRWSKAGPGKPLRLATRDGDPMRVPAGRSWIELVPESGDVSVR